MADVTELLELLHDSRRLAVVSMLAVGATGAEAFTLIREKTGLTAGNLSSHVRTMENAGMVSITKQFQGRRPLTTVKLTEQGRLVHDQFIREMEAIIRLYRDPSND